jgi:hypothetical protein
LYLAFFQATLQKDTTANPVFEDNPTMSRDLIEEPEEVWTRGVPRWAWWTAGSIAGIGCLVLLTALVASTSRSKPTSHLLRDMPQEKLLALEKKLYDDWEETYLAFLNFRSPREARELSKELNRVEKRYGEVRFELARRGIHWKNRSLYADWKVPLRGE